MYSPKIVMLEFNELCPPLLDRWMASGELPNFKALHNNSQVFITEADAEPPALEPWIQWYSIHTGLSFAQHQVFRLTDGPRAPYPDIWSILSRSGLATGNFSSMNAKRLAEPGSFFLADPWCTTEQAYPKRLQQFHNFVSREVQEYSNRGRAIEFAAAVKFLGFMAAHGLRAATVANVLSLLGHELFVDRASGWRRTVVLDWLQRDAFFSYCRKYRPAFATFFLNSTAHLQHSYWRCMDPNAFTIQPTPDEIEHYSEAIKFGYLNMDRLLGDFRALAAEEGLTLVLATGLSQQPFLRYENEGGQNFYRPRDVNALLRDIGVRAAASEPVMTHQYVLRFADDDEARAEAKTLIADLVCAGRQVFEIGTRDQNALYIGCQLATTLPPTVLLQSKSGRFPDSPFFDTFYHIDALKSGCHHPDGVLWIGAGEPQVHRQKVSVLDIFPTILEMLGVDYAPSDAHPFAGSSLLPLWEGPAERADTGCCGIASVRTSEPAI